VFLHRLAFIPLPTSPNGVCLLLDGFLAVFPYSGHRSFGGSITDASLSKVSFENRA
jgi:hypothetical protein